MRFAYIAFASACAASPLAPAPVEIAMPGPGPLARHDAASRNAACESCHAEAAATWRSSLHARAWTDPVFERSFAKEPAAFCRDCHAPEVAAPAIGVACVTCHDPKSTGEILAVPRATSATSERAPHAVRRDSRFAGDGACASCHEFPFPDVAARGGDGARMQRTIEEHAASRFADRTCASCHMPKLASGARGHAFAVEPMLARALVVRATRSDEGVRIDLSPGEIGHAFPTGDLFRRLVIVAEVADDPRARAERALARRFRFETNAEGAKIQREIGDDRVAAPKTVEIVLGPEARGREIAWRVEWQRVVSMRGDVAEIASAVIVASGRL
ncbi:MAG: hypothetical protein KF819_32995 [Labilithrix sp.]|nr:hypothetical protein [Labilithrix sp.]